MSVSEKKPRNPYPTVDVIIYAPGLGVLLIERRNPPYGWALPGGFVDYGETVERAAVREAKEETGLDVVLTGLLGVYSEPDRDPRKHSMSTVFTAQAANPEQAAAGDDAAGFGFFALDELPQLAFDHGRILDDFKSVLRRYSPGRT
jgi:8-oxo-dGTP diphosphatase